MATPARWIVAAPNPAVVGQLERELGLPAALARVLVNRGFADPAAARAFLAPRLAGLSDPFDLPAMRPAVDRLLAALAAQERIVIYGDYDVDGVTSSALLRRALDLAGASVANFLPLRMDEGYGLSADGIERCLAEHQPQLLIAVDCGTTSVAEIARLEAAGVDVIVLDHHEPPAALPACVGLVNPKRAAAPGPEASVGVTFKFVHALLKSRPDLAARMDLRDQLDLVALGTVADLVPLRGENRILVKAGLDRLGRSGKTGIRALCAVAGLGERITPSDVGFRLGPRLNAAGRLDNAMHALELLLTDDPARASELADQLDEQNRDRQTLQAQTVAAALEMIHRDFDPARDCAVALAREGWHPGVIGIVAARILQATYRPTIIIAVENGIGKGSCRSIDGFSMVAALDACRALLVKHGGHEMAAGLTIDADKIDAFRAQFNAVARARLTAEQLVAPLRIDAPLRLVDLDDRFFDQLAQFEPCGMGNPTPCFLVTGLTLQGAPRVLKEKHLKFRVTDGSATVDAIWWNGVREGGLPAAPLDLACVPEINRYRGAETVQLRVRAARAS